MGLEKLKAEAERLGKGSFAFAFYMDRQKEERERGVRIACTTKEFYTEKWHYTIIDAPGHRDFIKNMITGASQADVALIMVPADGNFTTAIAKGNHKAGEIQGQTRQHSRLINLLGVKQICIGVNKMDCDTAAYKQARYDEIANEMKSMLVKVGWKKDFIEKNTPVLPISGWMGDNLLKKSTNMTWWKGMDVTPAEGTKAQHVETLFEVLDEFCTIPTRPSSAPMRMPISGIYKIKETGGKKMEDPHALKSNEMAQCSFQPQQPLVCDTFKNCEGLSRVAFMDGNGVVMLGKVISCERKEEAAGGAGGKKK